MCCVCSLVWGYGIQGIICIIIKIRYRRLAQSRLTPMLVYSLLTSALAPAPAIEIAPGVDMPYVSLGFGSGQKGDVVSATELWVNAGGVGIDTGSWVE